MTLIFILGGARSGKSARAQRWAEARCAGSGRAPLMIATGQAFDDEMRVRIARHRAERGDAWRTLEAPRDLAAAIGALQAGDVAVVDCLTLWVSNLLLEEADLDAAAAGLLTALVACPADLAIVSNEVGLGIVPDNALARRFRDAAGSLHQAVAAKADTVLFMVAGLALTMKDDAPA